MSAQPDRGELREQLRALIAEFGRHEKAFMERMEQDAQPRLRFHEGLIAQLEKGASLKILDEQYEKDFRGSRNRRGGGGGDE